MLTDLFLYVKGYNKLSSSVRTIHRKLLIDSNCLQKLAASSPRMDHGVSEADFSASMGENRRIDQLGTFLTAIEDLMKQSRGELRRPVAEVESQYQNALVQNGTFDPTQQDPTTTGSPPRVPPTMQHVPVHDDPQRHYDVDDTSFAPSASEIFIFGEALSFFPVHSPDSDSLD